MLLDATAICPPMSAPAKLQLKLLVDRQSHRVLYAEAGKDAADFLLGLLRLPLGFAARILTQKGTPVAGAIGSLYTGVQSLDDIYLLSPPGDREELLNPSLPSASLPLLDEKYTPAPPPPAPKKYYRCPGYSMPCRGNPTNVTDVFGQFCPGCRQSMVVEMKWVPEEPPAARRQPGAGYVKGVITYLVLDDLTVTPMSTISAIMMLNKFSVADVTSLQEVTVDVGMEEGLKLLQALLESATVLTDVFVGKQQRGVSIDRL